MKRTFRIRMAILLIVLVSAIFFITFKIIKYNNKKYDITEVKQYNYFLVKENNLFGVIDKEGKIVINPEYEDVKIPNPEKSIFVCYKDNQIKVLNNKNEEILKQYESVEAIRLKNVSGNLTYEKSVLKYLEDGKYGLINFQGKKITKPIYDEIDGLEYKEGELLIKQNEKYGIISIKGKKIVDTKYDQISVDGYYTIEDKYQKAGYIISNKTEEGYRYGYINYSGKVIEKIQYNEISRILDMKSDDIYLLCARNGQYGITKNGKELIRNEYQSISYDESNNLLVIERSKKYGISKLDGNIIIPVEYSQIDITGIYLYAHNDQGIIVYDTEGKQVNIDVNVVILNTSNEKYRIRINNNDRTKYGLIEKNGKQLIEEKYNYMEYLKENYFIVSDENSKLGVIDDNENQKIEIKYDLLQKVKDTEVIQATNSKNEITELYSDKLDKICEMKNAIIEVQNEYIKIYNEEETKYFDKDGNELNSMQVYPENVLYAKQKNNKWGYVNKYGDVVVDYKYDRATEFNEYGYAAVKLDNKWGVVDKKGNEIQSPIYELNTNTIPSFIGKYYKITFGFGEFYYTK